MSNLNCTGNMNMSCTFGEKIKIPCTAIEPYSYHRYCSCLEHEDVSESESLNYSNRGLNHSIYLSNTISHTISYSRGSPLDLSSNRSFGYTYSFLKELEVSYDTRHIPPQHTVFISDPEHQVRSKYLNQQVPNSDSSSKMVKDDETVTTDTKRYVGVFDKETEDSYHEEIDEFCDSTIEIQKIISDHTEIDVGNRNVENIGNVVSKRPLRDTFASEDETVQMDVNTSKDSANCKGENGYVVSKRSLGNTSTTAYETVQIDVNTRKGGSYRNGNDTLTNVSDYAKSRIVMYGDTGFDSGDRGENDVHNELPSVNDVLSKATKGRIACIVDGTMEAGYYDEIDKYPSRQSNLAGPVFGSDGRILRPRVTRMEPVYRSGIYGYDVSVISVYEPALQGGRKNSLQIIKKKYRYKVVNS
eukprot:Tbor_TRINITY_DN5684_c0_g1::TRINITY_DN5684_c0_g1_i10::g.9287::m.9287